MEDKFYHKYTLRVRFHEVDMLGVCNNAVYINYFEDARLRYLKDAGLIPKGGVFSDGRLFFMVRNEINYRGHAFYDEELEVETRISFVKNSSFGFEHRISRKSGGEVIVDGAGVVVHVDPGTRKSTPLPEEFYHKVRDYQGEFQIIE